MLNILLQKEKTYYKIINLLVVLFALSGLLGICFFINIEWVNNHLLSARSISSQMIFYIQYFRIYSLEILITLLAFSSPAIFISRERYLLIWNRIQPYFQHWWPVLLLLLLFIPLLFYPKIVYPLPYGYGGLYALFSETLAKNSFILPSLVPYYGPGGIPFAYPPLAFYLMGFITKIFSMSSLNYMRFFPSIFMLGNLLAVYFLARDLGFRKVGAFCAAFLFQTSIWNYSYHFGAEGVVRGLAFNFTLWGFIFLNRSFKGNSRKTCIIAAILFGMTILTHLNYAVFWGVLTISLFIVSPKEDLLNRFGRILLVGAGGLFIAAPWIITIIHNFGLQVFQNAARTHGATIIFELVSQPNLIASRILNPMILTEYPMFEILAVIGFFVQIIRKRFFIPVWSVLTILIIGEYFHLLSISNAFLAGLVLEDVLEFIHRQLKQAPWKTILSYGAIGSILLICIWSSYPSMVYAPSLTNDLINTAVKINEITPPSAKYLLISSDLADMEWFTYFAKREPIVSAFGSEWVGKYYQQQGYISKIQECNQLKDTLGCVLEFVKFQGLEPDVIIVKSSGIIIPPTNWLQIETTSSNYKIILPLKQ